MMMATLHGLTRSRPDLLTESLTTFSTFTAPAKMPKDEIGAHLEAKLAEGEVLREFERIPKKKLEDCRFDTAMQVSGIVLEFGLGSKVDPRLRECCRQG